MHALSVRREEINIVAGKAAAHRKTKWIRLCLAGVLYDWQVHPDQTKAVKGQNSKTLVTTDTIKRPLPCPVERDRKTEDFSQRKRESRVRGKEKRLERKQREKKRKLRKKRES